MDTNLNNILPIYMQIMDKIRVSIIAGELAPGEKIPSVRELAETFSVNPNTMQRALSELEKDGLLLSERTAGRFVTVSTETISAIRHDEAHKIIENFVFQMKSIGYSDEDIKNFFLTDGVFDSGKLQGAV